MVAGMSVKGSEPRGGTSSHQSRRPGSTGQQTKAKVCTINMLICCNLFLYRYRN